MSLAAPRRSGSRYNLPPAPPIFPNLAACHGPIQIVKARRHGAKFWSARAISADVLSPQAADPRPQTSPAAALGPEQLRQQLPRAPWPTGASRWIEDRSKPRPKFLNRSQKIDISQIIVASPKDRVPALNFKLPPGPLSALELPFVTLTTHFRPVAVIWAGYGPPAGPGLPRARCAIVAMHENFFA